MVSELAAVRKARLERMRIRVAMLVVGIPFLGIIAAISLWLCGYGPGAAGIVPLISMYFITMLGVEVGYHRLFTHQSYKASPRLRTVMAALGSMAAEGPVIWWVAVHRRHHSFTDRVGDPHSPNLSGPGIAGKLKGLVHAHVGWMLSAPHTSEALVENFPRDLQRDPAITRINKHYFRWVALGLLLPTLLGGLIAGNWYGVASGFLWGGLVRIFLTSQFSFALNSLCHIPHLPLSRRQIQTAGSDQSRDSMWLVIPTLGQGYHNRHHGFPSVGVLGEHWWEFDIGGWILVLLERFGWVSDLKRMNPDWRKSRRYSVRP